MVMFNNIHHIYKVSEFIFDTSLFNFVFLFIKLLLLQIYGYSITSNIDDFSLCFPLNFLLYYFVHFFYLIIHKTVNGKNFLLFFSEIFSLMIYLY